MSEEFKSTREGPRKCDFIRVICGFFVALVVLLSAVLFVPPLRDRVFSMSLCPWTLPGEVTQAQLQVVQKLARPGDVVVESNNHFFQWVALSYVFTGSSWVHAALVDRNKQLITMEGKVEVLPITIYGKWRSTRLALIRPPYATPAEVNVAISHARLQVGTAYDPWFKNPDASCTGIVAEALRQAGIEVPYKLILGRHIYGADSFLRVPGARILWSTQPLTIQHGAV